MTIKLTVAFNFLCIFWLSCPLISDSLSKNEIPTAHDKESWHEETVRKILENEKYVGASLCQKTYTTSTFPFVRQYNHGNVNQYYIENTHPAIITKEIFEKAQALRRCDRTRYLRNRDTTGLAGEIEEIQRRRAGNC